MPQQDATTLFWQIAEEMYSDPSVREGTMMGFKCLRVNGDFFATLDHKNNALIIKLPKDRVTAMVEIDEGLPFAPNGRVFKEWVTVPTVNRKSWTALLAESKAFVSKNSLK